MTNKEDMTKTERRIYITKNARMISEKRLKFYSKVCFFDDLLYLSFQVGERRNYELIRGEVK